MLKLDQFCHNFSYIVVLVNVVPGLTNITLTWDAYSVANDKLEFKVENDMFARIVECRGQLGRKVIRHLPPRTTYHVTVTLITNDGIWLQRDVVFSTFVTMPKICESLML